MLVTMGQPGPRAVMDDGSAGGMSSFDLVNKLQTGRREREWCLPPSPCSVHCGEQEQARVHAGGHPGPSWLYLPQRRQDVPGGGAGEFS